jgi:hypothetical protein
MVKRGVTLNFSAVSRSFGSSSKAIKKVEMTLTVMVLSHPSQSSNFGVAIPAFSITTSNRCSVCARAQNDLTLSYDARSTCQTSTTFSVFVDFSISALAISPFWILRQAIMTRLAFSLAKCRAASNPSPQFDPVTMTV